MMNLLENDALLTELQESIDDACILEDAEDILNFVMTLDDGEHEDLHDTDERQVVRVYRTTLGFRLHSTAWDIEGNDVKANFLFSDYESGFDSIEGYDHEEAQERREAVRVERQAKQALKQEKSLERFLCIEAAYLQGEKKAHPYLLAKGILVDNVNIDFRVITAPLFTQNQPMELLIYKLSDDAYQVITPRKLELNGKPQDKFNIIRESGMMRGAYAVVGNGEPEFIVEGLADAISANMVLERPVAIGLNAGNIKHIAEALPELILIGDNDEAGRLSAKQSGLDAIFCTEHKDIDDMRQDKGLVTTKHFLEQEVGRIEQDRAPLLGDSNQTITLVSAPPGTGKSYHECRRIIQGSGLTIYAVHNKKAMGQEDSRISMIRDICTGDDNLTLPTIRRVNDSESKDTITVQFNRIIDEFQADETEDKNWVVFITHQGMSLLSFDFGDDLAPALVIDEVPDAFKVNNQQMNADNLSTYLNYFDVSIREFSSYYIATLIDLNRNGRAFIADQNNKKSLETKLYWKLIDQVMRSRNHTNFLHIEKGSERYANCFNTQTEVASRIRINTQPKVTKCEVFDADLFDSFSEIRILSDDCENSVLALLLERTQGVQCEVERLPSRHTNGVASRIGRIIGITEQQFSKNKMDTRPDLSNNIAHAIADECDLANSLWLLNNASRDNGDALAYLKEAGHEVDDFNPMTHGRNDLTRFDTVIMLYSLKPSPIESALMENLGISNAEITRWREHNVHMQNAFRCFLRNPTGEQMGTLVFPDKASIEYFLNRIENEWGVDERVLVEAKVSYLTNPQLLADFESKPSGRKMAGDIPLTRNECNKLSLWRKEMPLLNDFSNTLTQGLKSVVSLKKKELSVRYDAWEEGLQAANEDIFVNNSGYSF
ncbi:hypothetical protein [Vibrio sp. MA40-2]|uniref:hypothetical protein n=1 Tax=Vibrio sp. MA40-2 TaxID=3391828 RepID=UPI0039A50AF5